MKAYTSWNDLYAARRYPEASGWWDRHDAAVRRPENGFERAIVRAIMAWADYALEHKRRYESPIGDDGVLSVYWRDWGLAILGLLNGETGRLDCGTLDTYLRETAEANGAPFERPLREKMLNGESLRD